MADWKQLDKPLPLILVTGILLNAVVWGLAISIFPYGNPTAILHYSVDIGIDFIGEGKQIVILPLIGLFIIVCNGLLGMVLNRTDRRSAWIFWGIIPLAQAIIIGAFLLIWRANK